MFGKKYRLKAEALREKIRALDSDTQGIILDAVGLATDRILYTLLVAVILVLALQLFFSLFF